MFCTWQSVLQCSSIPKGRDETFVRNVFAVFPWICTSWIMRQEHPHRIAKWSAKTGQIRRCPCNWKADLVTQCKRRVHTWAGHIAKASSNCRSLRCWGLQRWTWRQAQDVATKDKLNDPQRHASSVSRESRQIERASASVDSCSMCQCGVNSHLGESVNKNN